MSGAGFQLSYSHKSEPIRAGSKELCKQEGLSPGGDFLPRRIRFSHM